jgi:hypothetical protein
MKFETRNDMAEIIYILTNPVMPGIVKMGKTDKEDVQERVSQLFTTAIPVPFDCVCASIVENNEDVEKLLHNKFARQRVNLRRKFLGSLQEKQLMNLNTLNSQMLRRKYVPKLIWLCPMKK